MDMLLVMMGVGVGGTVYVKLAQAALLMLRVSISALAGVGVVWLEVNT